LKYIGPETPAYPAATGVCFEVNNQPYNLLRLATMSNQTVLLINTWLQPGVGSTPTSEPFQRLAVRGKPLKRF
jgi:hypothetical protein